MAAPPAIRFAVVGLEHAHAYGITVGLLGAGAQLAGFHSTDDDQATAFETIFDHPPRHTTVEQLVEDAAVELVVVAGVPAERAGVAVAAMQAGKDVVSAKPGVTTAAQLAAVRAAQATTGRTWTVWFSERLESRATIRACDLVRAGSLGRVVQVVGFGPHRLGLETRPSWFLDPARNGGIVNDLASHQIEQVLHLTGHDDGRIGDVELVASLVANRAHPDDPDLEDYGEVQLRTPHATATLRVDWFTPDGLPTWGDVRLFVVGTEGTVEVRKNCDLGTDGGADTLLVVDHDGVRRIDASGDTLTWASTLVDDVRRRSCTLMAQDHVFAVCDLALRAQTQADRAGHLREGTTP